MEIIKKLPLPEDARLLVGSNTADDAGVYQINDTEALVVSTDFFPPIVDDPLVFGQIAAANALSDVYAMGGRPLVALNIIGFPYGKMPTHIMHKILLGGYQKVTEAGAVIAGGHSVKDAELKYGLAVTGIVKIEDLKTNSSARVGDRIIVTKPLGTGIVSTAMKNNVADAATIDLAVRQMAALNRHASEVAAKYRCSAVTDITGYGLVGHTLEMAEASSVTVRINVASVPIIPGAIELTEKGQLTGGGRDNIKYCEPKVTYTKPLSDSMIHVLHDPQTSGGLLIAVHPVDADKCLDEILTESPSSAIIGDITPGAAGIVFE